MQKQIRITITLPEHTPAASMGAIAGDPGFRGGILRTIAEWAPSLEIDAIAVDAIVTPDEAPATFTSPDPPVRLTCTGMGARGPCELAVGMIDREGYIYCGPCGLTRRSSGTPCRTLTGKELRQLRAGQTIRYSK